MAMSNLGCISGILRRRSIASKGFKELKLLKFGKRPARDDRGRGARRRSF